jgi:glycine cleavage system T protein (aminomethyltransferase)
MPLPTPFHPRTSALCESLRFKEWAGYFAVASYDGHSDAEYFAFRNAAGLLDISPLYKYEITGPDSAAFLAYVATRDVRALATGRVTYACVCDAHGKVIDDGTIARLDDQRFRVTTASPTFGWLHRNRRGFDVTIRDVSDRTAALALQGPSSRAVLADLVGTAIAELRFFRVAAATIAGVEVEISRTGFTGDLGYEIWIPAGDALSVFDAIMESGRPHGLRPAGLDALDVTRIEAGFVLQDVDYFSAPRCAIESRKSSPLEIGLDWTVDLDRDGFVGQDALRAEKARGSTWQLVGLDISWEGIEALYSTHGLPPNLSSHASRDAVPVYVGSRQFGQVTSSTWSPLLKKYVAIATLKPEYAALDTEVLVEHTVEFERTSVKATVVRRPFFDPERKRA